MIDTLAILALMAMFFGFMSYIVWKVSREIE